MPFKDIIGVKLNKNFLELLIEKLKVKYKKRSAIFRDLDSGLAFESFNNYLNASYKHFRSLGVIVKLCELSGISLEELEKNIIQYRTSGGRVTITNPKLPIEINPIFDMLIIHLMADGCCIKFKNKSTIYYFYRQYNEFFRNIFIKKAEAVFGNLLYQRNYFDKTKGVYLPEVITLVLLNQYNLTPDDFLTEKARLPTSFFSKEDEFLLSYFLAFIIDEGNIDSSGICIRLKNRGLILDIQEVVKRMGYESAVSRDKEMWVLYLRVDATRAIYRRYIKLKEVYGEISLGGKEEKLRFIIDRESKELKNQGEGMVKNKIVDLLKGGDKSIKELSFSLSITRQGIRYHINELRELGVIETRNERKNYICKLKRERRFEEKLLGRSRPIGKTRKEILGFLSKSNLNTIEIADIVKIRPNNIRQHLWNLEAENKIKRIGKDRKKILWSISTK
ncbi:MAG: winged helix-turn-helix domain-containing protein [Candidatus Aenigmatarchaeota archaeon]